MQALLRGYGRLFFSVQPPTAWIPVTSKTTQLVGYSDHGLGYFVVEVGWYALFSRCARLYGARGRYLRLWLCRGGLSRAAAGYRLEVLSCVMLAGATPEEVLQAAAECTENAK